MSSTTAEDLFTLTRRISERDILISELKQRVRMLEEENVKLRKEKKE